MGPGFKRASLIAAFAMILGTIFPLWAQQDGPMPAAQPTQPPAQPAVQKPTGQPVAVATVQTTAASNAKTPAGSPAAQVRIPSGTVLPLVLHNGISTRSAKIGDPVYFETLFPVMVEGRVAIPAGSYVSGEVTESVRPGRVKGRAELMVKLTTLILPNAYMVNLNAIPSDASTGGAETVDDEGRVKGDSDKGGDAGTIASTTIAGAGIGSIASRSGKGAGIGAGVGAAAGLVAVLLTRGPEAEMPRGTTVNVTLTRPLFLDADKDQFTTPGTATALPGPGNREPVRNKFPF